ncbi:MAG: UvrB/UvrC motif-containing protein [Planctomycetota bacterium]
MKCQYCEKPATFHITELTEESGPQVMHLCEEHAKGVLNKTPGTSISTFAGELVKQLGQSPDELEELDQKECPVCGITFKEFRNSGRLGCPFDYTHFESDLRPLLVNVHDKTQHVGKQPNRSARTADNLATLIGLRREMDEAIEREDYERASEIRDEIRAMENPTDSNPSSTEDAS